MAVRYTDGEIEALIREMKRVDDERALFREPRTKRGHAVLETNVEGLSGSHFRVFARQNLINRLDFSIILCVVDTRVNAVFRLRRYNGRSHRHTNRIERDSFYDFHIHQATQRYQELGKAEDSFAEPTERYSDRSGAMRCLIVDANIEVTPSDQRVLF